MKLYHRTPCPQEILDGGFRDSAGFYLTSEESTGVWFSDVPVAMDEGAKGSTVLCIDAPESQISEFEWIEEGKPYREWQIPAELANSFGRPVIHDDDYKGCSRKKVQQKIESYRFRGNVTKAAKLEAHLAFLERHGLLAEEARED